MVKYRHTKGQIADNALHALLYDPLFKQRVEKNIKGKGSYRRKEKHNKSGEWETGGKYRYHGIYLRSFFYFQLLNNVS